MPYNTPSGRKEAMSNDHIAWIKDRLIEAKEDGKTPIVICHEAILLHFPAVTEIAISDNDSVQFRKLADTLADNGAYYVFSGHFHMQNITTRTTSKNNVLYEVSTASFSLYPSAYREVTFNRDTVAIDTIYIERVNEDYLPEYVSDYDRALITEDFHLYAIEHINRDLFRKVNDFSRVGGTLDSINVGGDLKIFLSLMASEVFDKILSNPFYMEDEEDNISLERILSNYDIAMPATNYKSMKDIGALLVRTILGGDEDLVGSPDIEILQYVFYSMAYYMNQAYDTFIDNIYYYDIYFDLDDVFLNDTVNCYTSGLIPTALELIQGNLDPIIENLINIMVSGSFNNLFLFKGIIQGFTKGHIDIEAYHNSHSIFLDLVYEGIFNTIARDLIEDTAPADNFLIIYR